MGETPNPPQPAPNQTNFHLDLTSLAFWLEEMLFSPLLVELDSWGAAAEPAPSPSPPPPGARAVGEFSCVSLLHGAGSGAGRWDLGLVEGVCELLVQPSPKLVCRQIALLSRGTRLPSITH